MEGPGVAPVVEGRGEVEAVETRADICDDPEDEPHRRPLNSLHQRESLRAADRDSTKVKRIAEASQLDR